VKTVSLMQFEPFRSFRDLDRLSSQLLSGTRVPMAMPMDVWREGQTYHVALDLPGVDPDGIDLSIERNTLTVTAERRAPFDGGGGQEESAPQVVVAERPQGSFSRQLVLGEGLDSEAVRADYSNGVLHLTVPVRQAAQPRRIQVGKSSQPRVIEADTGQADTGQSDTTQSG
jgi:HSP20 family protein